jgi:hypothetical protein
MPVVSDGQPDGLAVQPITADEGLERRAFVRKATTDAVSMAGRFYSLSKVLSRSVGAAGQSMVDSLETIRLEQSPGQPADQVDQVAGQAAAITGPAELPESDTPAAVGASSAFDPAITRMPVAEIGAIDGAAVTGSPMQPASGSIGDRATDPPVQPVAEPPGRTASEPPARVPLTLSGSQATLLDTVQTAVLGAGRPGLGPHLTPAQFHWDGWVFRIPSLGWSARIQNIRQEPRVTLFVEDLATGEFGSIGGRATIAEGRFARDQSGGLLARYHPGADPDERWAQLLAEDIDRVVIVIDPDQAIWGRRS